MAFPQPELTKWVRAREIAVALAAVAHAEADPVGLTIARETPFTLAPRARRSVIVEMIRSLDGTTPRGTAALAPLLTAARAPRIAVVTDLLGDLDELMAAAKLRIAGGGEVIVVHLVAPEELDPPGDALLAVDPERPGVRRTLDGTARGAYTRAFAAWMEEAAGAFRSARGRYVPAGTTRPAVTVS